MARRRDIVRTKLRADYLAVEELIHERPAPRKSGGHLAAVASPATGCLQENLWPGHETV